MSTWKPEYSVKINFLDDQHKEFFRILDELSQAIESKNLLDLDFIMIKLKLYSLYHFTCEEHNLIKYGYPDFENHKDEHKKFRKEVELLMEKVKANPISVAEEAKIFMGDWWTNHILKIDKEYSSYLVERLKNIPF